MERTSPRLVIHLTDGSERVVDLRDGRMNVGRAPVTAEGRLSRLAPTRPRPFARRIFVSHASEDKRRARMIAGILRRQGWEPWIDESGIIGGSSWAASIQQALKASSVVVLLITANSVAKERVLRRRHDHRRVRRRHGQVRPRQGPVTRVRFTAVRG